MPRQRVRTGGVYFQVYLDKRLKAILEKSAEAKGISLNTLITRELAFLYADNGDQAAPPARTEMP